MFHSQFSKEVIEFIRNNEQADIASLAMKKSPFEEVSMKEIAQQLYGRKIAKKKYPFLLEYDQFRFPVKESLEQASSQKTALFKSNIMEGQQWVDLTGGMGIDTYLLGQNFKESTYVEPNETLYNLTITNFSTLGLSACKGYNLSCEEFLNTNTENFDWAYVDPSRRINGVRKTSIYNYEPNIVELYPKMKRVANNVMVKLSPMQDISECVDVLKDAHKIWVISIENEVKELLLQLRPDASIPEIIAVDIDRDKKCIYSASFEDRLLKIESGPLRKYIYQPSSSIIKAGLQNSYSKKCSLIKLHPNTQLYTSNDFISDYYGRVFEVKHSTHLNKKNIKKVLPQMKANVISKNFPLSPSQIKAKINISDGGDDYLIAFTGYNQEKLVAICNRLEKRAL